MMVRRWLGVGTAVALTAGGCAAQPKPLPATRPADGSAVTPATPAASPAASPADKPQWEAGGPGRQTPQVVADRAAAYARTAGDLTAPTAPVDADAAGRAGLASARSPRSAVQFDAPATPPKADVPPMPAAAPIATPAAPVVPAAAPHAGSDTPQEMPESADFLPTATASPSSAAVGPAPASDPLGRRLAKQAEAAPHDPAAQLDYQLYQMLNGGPEPSAPMLSSDLRLPPEERDEVAAVVDGLSNFRGGLRADPDAPVARQEQPLADMLERMRSTADLTIGPVALCRRVEGFGRYDPVSPARFPMGRPTQVIVYYQLDGVQPQRSTDGRWEAHLTQQASLYNEAGTKVWGLAPRPVTDVCRDRRRDFYAFEMVTLPATLPIGAYRLKMSVTTDRATNKQAEGDVPLWIGG